MSHKKLPKRPRAQSTRGTQAIAALDPRGGAPYLCTATEAKNDFGKLLDRVSRGETVRITKHDSPRAVLLSIDEYESLSRSAERALDTLSGEFDALLERMQTAKARDAMRTAFGASPKQLGGAALAAASKRG